MTNLIRPDLIVVKERTRDLIPEHRDELVSDIRKNGLLYPLILGNADEPPLVDGLHRLSALEVLISEGFPIIFDGEALPDGCVPFIRFSDIEPVRLLEAEIASNLFRRELTWQERTIALARLHQMELEKNPDATISQTATKLAGATGKSESTIRQAISRAIVVAEAMEETPELASSRSETEAMSRLKSDLTRLSSSLLAGGFATTNSLHRLIPGDLITILPTLKGEGFQLILADPPYGVRADSWTSKFQDAPHHYTDDWKTAANIASAIFTYGMEITDEFADLFLFCAPERWNALREMAEGLGWSVWPRPVIWHKSNEGIRPWGQKGFAYCYEGILYATKNQKGLRRTGPDVIAGIYKVRDREHGAAKPPELYRNLIETTCLPGDRIIDPCCGSGTIFEAATLTSTIATGIEVNEHYLGLCQQRMLITKESSAQEEFDAL